jgi:hypothetical protein
MCNDRSRSIFESINTHTDGLSFFFRAFFRPNVSPTATTQPEPQSPTLGFGLKMRDCVFMDLSGGDGGELFLNLSTCETTINGSAFINNSAVSSTESGGGCYLNNAG